MAKPSNPARKAGVGGISLDRFAKAKTSGYDKRTVLEKAHNAKLNKIGKYKRLLKRKATEEGAAKLSGRTFESNYPKDNIAELEEVLGLKQIQDGRRGGKRQRGSDSHEQNPSSDKHQDNDTEDSSGSEDVGEEAFDGQQACGSNHGTMQETDLELASAHDNNQRLTLARQNSGKGSGSHLTQAHKSKQQGQDSTVSSQSRSSHEKGRNVQQGVHGQEKGSIIGKGGRPPSRLQRLMTEAAERKVEAQQAREQALKAKAEKQAKIEESQKARREEKQRFFKRTRTGQPLMRYRIESILGELQRGQK